MSEPKRIPVDVPILAMQAYAYSDMLDEGFNNLLTEILIGFEQGHTEICLHATQNTYDEFLSDLRRLNEHLDEKGLSRNR